MKYKIYTSEGCIRCTRAKNKLVAEGHTIEEEHNAERHSRGDLSGWRGRPVDFAEFKANLCLANEELPILYNITMERFLTRDETDKLCKR